MNFIKQFNTFFENLLTEPLSSNAVYLYFTLFYINNKCNWKKEFTVANSTIMGLTSFDKNKLVRARNELKQKGYINYKNGKNQIQSGTYEILDFDTALDTAYDTPNDTADDTADDTAVDTNNKQNKTKQKKKNIKKKFFGEYQNVFFTDEQYQKLLAEFPSDYKQRIQKLDDYMQSKGIKYKDCLATIRNWARKDGYVKPTKPKEEYVGDYVEIDYSQLTNEEYEMLMKKKITIQELIEKGKLNV